MECISLYILILFIEPNVNVNINIGSATQRKTDEKDWSQIVVLHIRFLSLHLHFFTWTVLWEAFDKQQSDSEIEFNWKFLHC